MQDYRYCLFKAFLFRSYLALIVAEDLNLFSIFLAGAGRLLVDYMKAVLEE